jgi:hypothetical protein
MAAKRTTAKKQSKFGADPRAAKKFGGKNDFGIPASSAARTRAVSDEIKNQPEGSHRTDPRPARSGEDGARVTGVGGNASGPGSSSGGDLDPDIVGVGTGGSGISQAGPDDNVSQPEMSDGTSNEFASGPPARGRNQSKRRGRVGGTKRVQGTTHNAGENSDENDGGG